MTPDELIRQWGIAHFYHFTDVANLASIRESGGLYSLHDLEKRCITIPRPGGNEWSHDADRRRDLHRFVHLGLRSSHPMRYRAEQEGRIGPVAELEVSPSVLEIPGVRFTLEVSNKAETEILEFDKWSERMDFEVVYSRLDWRDPVVNQRLQSAAKAEILIPAHVPLGLIGGI